MNKGAWPQVRTDQLLCVSETWNHAGAHPGKSEHARTERSAMTTSPIFRESQKGKMRKVAVRQVYQGLIGTFQGVAPGRKVCLPSPKAVCQVNAGKYVATSVSEQKWLA